MKAEKNGHKFGILRIFDIIEILLNLLSHRFLAETKPFLDIMFSNVQLFKNFTKKIKLKKWYGNEFSNAVT